MNAFTHVKKYRPTIFYSVPTSYKALLTASTEALNIFISNRPGWAIPESTDKVVPGYDAKIVDENGLPLPREKLELLISYLPRPLLI